MPPSPLATATDVSALTGWADVVSWTVAGFIANVVSWPRIAADSGFATRSASSVSAIAGTLLLMMLARLFCTAVFTSPSKRSVSAPGSPRLSSRSCRT